ncbi:hypothetical protein AB3N60_17615 [Leptospira sp. WS39.C2]
MIGIWLVPGHNINSLVTIKGSLWDSKSGYLIMAVRGEGQDDSLSSLYTVMTESAVTKSIKSATEKAVNSLLDDIKDEIPKARMKIDSLK